jgi:chromosome segregation ATPase
MQKLREKDEVQQRELELLRAQLALYQQAEHKHHAQSKDGGGGEAKHGPAHSNQALAASLSLAPGKNAHTADDGDHENRDAAGARRGGQPQQQQRSASGGYILGVGVGEGMLEADVGGARGALAARWEAEKTLRQRVQSLEKKLQEAAQENSELRDTVTRFNLQQQQQQQQHQQQRGHQGGSSSSSPTRGGSHKTSSAADNPNKATTTQPPRPAHELLELDAARRRVFELESDLSAARRRADVELTAQLRQLQQQLASATHQLRAAETQLAQHEERRKKEQQYGSGANNPLRASEDRFLREERLHDELDFARRQRLELEAQLLERDAQTLELRFESEEKAAERLRLQRRVKEQEDVIRQLREAAGHLIGTGAGDLPFSRIVGAGPGAGASGTGTGGSRRENELESVVESMKRVIEKLRADNERLRRGISGPLAGGTSNLGTSNLGGGQSHHQTTQQQPTSQNAPTSGTGTDWEKRFGAEKKRNEKLTEELNLLRAKQAEKEDSQTKLSQKTQQLSTLQKKLAKRDEEVQRQVGDITRLVAEKEALTRQLQQLQQQQQQQQLVQQQQQQPKQKHGAAGLSVSEEEEVLRQLTGTQADNDSLRLEVSDLRKKLASLSGSNSNSNRAGGGGDVDRLKEENAKLKAELAAFDLDFFEEIENLKFAHAEAVRKLKTFEQRFGPLR